jgi:hypothetical protein
MKCKGAMRILLAPAGDKPLPHLQLPQWAPGREPRLQTMVKAEGVRLTALLNAPSAGA